jgi:hypothetical protein
MERPNSAYQGEATGREEIMQKLQNVKNSVSEFVDFVPYVVEYLQQRCHEFVAGQVADHFKKWVALTNDKEILSDIVGMIIQCDEIPTQHRLFDPKRRKHEQSLINQEIEKLVQKQVIAPVRPEPDQILSGIFLHPKKNGSYLKQFNKYVSYHHFKMDSLNTITKLVVKNCYMASIDLKDAYYSIPIYGAHRKYLWFEWGGRTYEFTCLPNGLSCCPRKFTKIIKPLLAYLHKQSHISVGHIDDLYLQGQTYNQCVHNVADTVVLLDEAGFIVHPTKSSLIPSQEIIVLGFTLNSVNMIVRLTPQKASQLQQDCIKMLK